MPILIALYILLAFVLGLLARRTGLRFWGGFFFSLLATPFIGGALIFLLLWLQQRKHKPDVPQNCPFAPTQRPADDPCAPEPAEASCPTCGRKACDT